MKTIDWAALSEMQKQEALKRPAAGAAQDAEAAVRDILRQVRADGDAAIRRLTQRFDGYDPEPLFLPEDAIEQAGAALDPALRRAIDAAYASIRRFHEQQGYRPYEIETQPGLACTRMVVPVQRVGLYIPGGTAPLFSTVLMLGVPSQLAGNGTRILCTPGNRDGAVHPAILYAARLCGIARVARVGGAQAIAAMACGTASIDAVDKIFGPGNIYVTLAKTMAAQEPGGPAIDMPAGPSEVLVIADDAAPDAYVAADLLSQAEHDVSSQVVLVATSQAKVAAVGREIDRQLKNLPRAAVAAKALANSLAIVVPSLDDAIAVSNLYAPEHLILCCEGGERYRGQIKNAGSVFCGYLTPEALGDYASGTNHVLPTSASARAYSGLSVEAFQKTVTWQSASRQALEAIGPAVVTMAEAETLQAHAAAIKVRLEDKNR